MTRYGVTPNPNPDFSKLSATPTCLHSHNSSGLPSTLDSLRFGWID